THVIPSCMGGLGAEPQLVAGDLPVADRQLDPAVAGVRELAGPFHSVALAKVGDDPAVLRPIGRHCSYLTPHTAVVASPGSITRTTPPVRTAFGGPVRA